MSSHSKTRDDIQSRTGGESAGCDDIRPRPEKCPLCGQPNDCARAAQQDCKSACWCVKETFPPELLARVPEQARGCACICKQCLAEAQREK
ncbi:MAG: cysteine-rich CWC family protein [Verrucomicrobiota bacterium]